VYPGGVWPRPVSMLGTVRMGVCPGPVISSSVVWPGGRTNPPAGGRGENAMHFDKMIFQCGSWVSQNLSAHLATQMSQRLKRIGGSEDLGVKHLSRPPPPRVGGRPTSGEAAGGGVLHPHLVVPRYLLREALRPDGAGFLVQTANIRTINTGAYSGKGEMSKGLPPFGHKHDIALICT